MSTRCSQFVTLTKNLEIEYSRDGKKTAMFSVRVFANTLDVPEKYESFIIKDFNAVMRKCSIEIDELLNSGNLPVTVRSSCGKSHRMDKFCGFYISLSDNKR